MGRSIKQAETMTENQTPADAPTNRTISPTDEMMLDMMDIAEIVVEKRGQTNPIKTPTGKPTGKRTIPTKKRNSPKPKQGAGLNKIKQDELVKWTVFVQPETRASVNKAAEKAGLTVTDWIDSRLREAATTELTKKAQPPAKPEDMVTDIVQKVAERMKAEQETTSQAQTDLIRQQGEQLAALTAAIENQPRSIKEMLFGKVRKG